jgi:hypothetical protein
VAFRSLLPSADVAAPVFEADKSTVRAGDGSEITFDLFGSWEDQGSPQALIVSAAVPYETPDLLSCAGVDNGILPNTIFPGGGNPGGSGQPPTDLTDQDAANVLAAATWVRDHRPEFFAEEDRAVAYDMMTEVINHARGLGTDAMRCLAHPSMPPSNPYRWCSDALVVGQPGLGITVDVYRSWPDPATPQLLVTRTGDTGEMTADLIP